MPFDQTTFHQQLALAYHGGGWNATANLMYGIVGNGYGLARPQLRLLQL